MPYDALDEFSGSNEMTITAEDVVFSKDPEIMGEVVYRFEWRATGSSHDFEIEITGVEVEEIKSLIYNEDGSPVAMNVADKEKFTQIADKYFWDHVAGKAEAKAMERAEWGQ